MSSYDSRNLALPKCFDDRKTNHFLGSLEDEKHDSCFHGFLHHPINRTQWIDLVTGCLRSFKQEKKWETAPNGTLTITVKTFIAGLLSHSSGLFARRCLIVLNMYVSFADPVLNCLFECWCHAPQWQWSPDRPGLSQQSLV